MPILVTDTYACGGAGPATDAPARPAMGRKFPTALEDTRGHGNHSRASPVRVAQSPYPPGPETHVPQSPCFRAPQASGSVAQRSGLVSGPP